MAYYNMTETKRRLAAVRELLRKRNLDAALIYFDELNVANGWYLTAGAGSSRKAVLAHEGEMILLGGLERAISHR